jgi:hypothetical protein
MSVASGPNIVTNGLVLSFDAKNSKSSQGDSTWYDMVGTAALTMMDSPRYDINGYYVFTGSSQYATSTSNVSSCNFYNTGSIEIWSKLTDWSDFWYAPLIQQGASAGWDTDGWGIESWPGNIVYGWLHNHDAGVTINVNFGNESSIGYGFNQYMLTWTRTYVGGYLNGILTQGYTFADCQPCGNGIITQVMLLSAVYGRSFGENVGIIKAYNRCLSQDEVIQNYNSLKSRYGLV